MIDIINIKVYDENDYILDTFVTLEQFESYLASTPNSRLDFTYPEFTVKVNGELETMTPEEYYGIVSNKG